MSSYLSTSDPTFRSCAEDWLARSGELSVHLRFSRAAGSCSFEFFSDRVAFFDRLGQLPASTFVSVFRDPQLPVRGRVDETFIESVLAALPDGTEYIVAGLELITIGSKSWYEYEAGTSQADLRDCLEGCLGELVAVGPYPDYRTLGPDRAVSAIVPESDGSVVVGVY